MKCNKKVYLTLLTIISICSVIILIIGILMLIEYFNQNFKNVSQKNECLTESCNKSVSILYHNMNLNVDPCEDFYEFTCGNFVKNARISDDKAQILMLNSHNNEVFKNLQSILEEPITSDIEPFLLAKKLYFACMNESNLEIEGLHALHEILFKFGGWPVLEKKWKDTHFNWINTTVHIGKIGYSINSIINIDVDLDARNNSERILSVDQAILGLNREFLKMGLKNEVVAEYFDYMINVSVHLGAKKSFATKDLLEILLFEIKLANISLSNEDRQDANKLYNPISVKELQETYPFIPWLTFINDILPPSVQIHETEILLNIVPDYIRNLEIILKNTSKRTIANYILWHVVRESVPFLTKELRMIKNQLDSKLTGKIKENVRWQECTSTVQDTFPIALGSLYVRKHFDKESKIQVEEMVELLKLEFKKILENTDWMDSKTKKSALEKIHALNAFVAYPDELLDDIKIIDYYKNLTITKPSYLETILNISIFLNNKSYNQLRIPFNKNQWTRHGHTFMVDAYYSAYENSLDLPAGILQGILFSSDRPNYLNYGGIGFVIGHEMTHGFDNYGRQFDKTGNLVDWWEKTANDAFVKKAQCIVEQYGNYTTRNMSLNGVNTQSENIADNGAIQIAYNAYLKWRETHEEEPNIFGFNFTANQMFWISSATLWCSKYRPEYLKIFLTTDVHSPGLFRVNGVVSNQFKFAEDFNCAAGSKMNPIHKCKVW